MSHSTPAADLQGRVINPETLVAQLPALHYVEGVLCVDGVAVESLATTYGTPCYVYSKQAILDVYQAYTDSFSAV